VIFMLLNVGSHIVQPTIGVVDQIEGNIVVAEIIEVADDRHTVKEIELPIEIFPCEIEEGGMFYFEYVDGVTELRCGEPPV